MKLSHIIIHTTNVMTTEYCEALSRNLRNEIDAILRNETQETAHDLDEGSNETTLDLGGILIETASDLNEIESMVTKKDATMLLASDWAACDWAAREGIAFVPVTDNADSGCVYPDSLYVLEKSVDISIDTLIKIYQRFHGIAWTIVETDRLIIREQTAEDIDELYRIYDDGDITRYTEGLYEKKEDEIDYMKEYIDKQYRFFEYGIWAIVRRSDGLLVGRAGISDRAGVNTPEIGYVIRKQCRNMHYAKEALSAIMKYAKDELMMNELCAFTLPDNKASVALLKSLGFVRVGEFEIDNKLHDKYLYSNVY